MLWITPRIFILFYPERHRSNLGERSRISCWFLSLVDKGLHLEQNWNYCGVLFITVVYPLETFQVHQKSGRPWALQTEGCCAWDGLCSQLP